MYVRWTDAQKGSVTIIKNVLLITADHMRQDALGCYGNDFVKTPHLDALASRGVRFRNAFTPSPACVPARAAITTGNYPHNATGVKTMGGRIGDEQPKIAEHFNQAGYDTYAIGKLHYIPYAGPGEPRVLHGFKHAELTEEGRVLAKYDPQGERTGLEDYHDYLHEVGWGGYERAHGVGNNDIHPAPSPVPAEHFVDAWVSARSIHALERHVQESPERPFFMWTSFTKPHSPYDPPRPYDTLYDPRELPKPVGSPELLQEKSPWLADRIKNYGWDYFSPEAVALARAYYFGLVTFQDEMVGRLLHRLEELGLLEETVILYTSDHGDLLGDFGSFFKGNHLDGSARIPFIVSAHGELPAGVEEKTPAGLHDILPTVSALAGVPFATPVDGINLAPVCNGERCEREFVVGETGQSPSQVTMLCTGAWKYIYTEAQGFEELYDLENDPHELENLALKREWDEQRRSMRQSLIDWCKVYRDDQLLDGDDLVRADVEFGEPKFNVKSLGWRWY